MIDFEKFKALDFKKSVIVDMWHWVRDDDTCVSMGFNGKFFDNVECPYFHFGCDLFPEEYTDHEKLNETEIESFEISAIEPEKRYSVSITCNLDGKQVRRVFPAKKVSFELYKYLGMSYRNMYDIWLNELEKSAYVECDNYFQDEDTLELDDGFTLKIKIYADIEEKGPQY